MTLANNLTYGGIYFGAFGLGVLGESISPGHGRDVAFCLQSYSFVQVVTNGSMSPIRSAVIAFTVQGLGEVCQKYGLYPGTFDWKDFVAYAVGSALVFGTEKVIRIAKNNKKEELSDVVKN